MTDGLDFLADWLLAVGPGLLFALTFLETVFLTGLAVPAGVAFLVASFLASTGQMSLAAVVPAAVAGALLGDSGGFWVGRTWGARWAEKRSGWIARWMNRHREETDSMLGRHPFVSVSLARVVSVVRTLMPLTAGAGPLKYREFLLYDFVGIALWAATYAGVGFLSGEGWQRASAFVGAGWALVFAGGLTMALWKIRRRSRSRGRRSGRLAVGEGTPTAPSGEHQPLRVGLTGNIASGKSSVAHLWADEGVAVVSADQLARDVVEPGTPGLARLVEAFGSEILDEEGRLHRAGLRGRVFEDAEQRTRLEGIVHPLIAEARAQWEAEQARQGAPLLVAEVPLLFEAGLEDGVDCVVLVDAPEAVRLERLTRDRGLDVTEARAMMDAQRPAAEKRRGSHFVIDNDGDLEQLRRRALRVLGELRQRAIPPPGNLELPVQEGP